MLLKPLLALDGGETSRTICISINIISRVASARSKNQKNAPRKVNLLFFYMFSQRVTVVPENNIKKLTLYTCYHKNNIKINKTDKTLSFTSVTVNII